MQNFGIHLKLLRKQKGYSQSEIACELHVSRQAISQWEMSKSYPDLDNLILLAEIYDCSLDELINGEVSSSNNQLAENVVEENFSASELSDDRTGLIWALLALIPPNALLLIPFVRRYNAKNRNNVKILSFLYGSAIMLNVIFIVAIILIFMDK